MLSHCQVNTSYDHSKTGTIEVFVASSAVHSDIIVPIHSEIIDWSEELQLPISDSSLTYFAIGWGEKGFFLKTKEWSDLTPKTALTATFHLGKPALHIVSQANPSNSDLVVQHYSLTTEQYKKLAHFIKKSFVQLGGKYQEIKHHPYGQNNYFFKSTGSYGMFYTCNSWANDALKSCGLPACVWKAFN